MPSDMKKPPAPGKAEPASRHPYGPRPIGALLPAITRPAFRKQYPAAASLVSDWPSIVGPALAETTRPRRLTAGTLTLGCSGPVALELQHLAGPLMERVNLHLGRPMVQRLRFVQEAIPPRPPTPTRRTPPAPLTIEGMEGGALRDALASLGAEVAAARLTPDPAKGA